MAVAENLKSNQQEKNKWFSFELNKLKKKKSNIVLYSNSIKFIFFLMRNGFFLNTDAKLLDVDLSLKYQLK